MRANRPFDSARTVATTAAGAAATAADLAVDEILDGLAEGFFALDSRWRFVAFNRAAEEIFDLRREDVIGRTIWEVSPTAVGTRVRAALSAGDDDAREAGVRMLFDPPARSLSRDPRFPARRRDRRRLSRRHRSPGDARDAAPPRARARAGAEDRRRRGHVGRRARQFHGAPVSRISADLRPAARSGESSRTRAGFSASIPTTGRARSSACSPPSPAAATNTSRNTASSARATARCAGSGRSRRSSATPDGEATALVGAHIDITERKLAEQEAVESEERLRAITDALPVLISYVDSDQVFRFVNKTYETWFDRPRSEILGRRVDEVMSPEMYEARRSNLERALAGEEVSYEVEFPRSNGAGFHRSDPCSAPRRVRPGARRLRGRHRRHATQTVRARDRRERSAIPRHRQQRARADLGDRRRTAGANSSTRPISISSAAPTRRRSRSTGARPCIPTICRAFCARSPPSMPR